MISGSFLIVSSLLFNLFVVSWTAQPKCIDNRSPFIPIGGLNFCRTFSDFGCCDVEQDRHIKDFVESEWAKLESENRLSAYCYGQFKNLTCMQCSPFSFDIYFTGETDGENIFRSTASLCNEFCSEYINACPEVADRLLDVPRSSSDVATRCAAQTIESEEKCYPKSGKIETDSPLGELDCICTKRIAGGLRNPLVLTHSNDGTGRLFVAEHIGVIKIIAMGENDGEDSLLEEPFLDIQDKVFTTDTPGDERGLLGLVFDPGYHGNGYFYVYYSAVAKDENSDHISVVSRFSVSNQENKADPDSEKIILEINQPGAGQNGGQLVFGTDESGHHEYLYVTVGYGGADEETAVDKSNLLGSILRIDVRTEDDDNVPYKIPPENPFVDDNNARPEIYAYGFRNPWRCSVDRGNNSSTKMFCGDVGDSTAEEINLVEKGGYYGWYYKEGHLCRVNTTLQEQCIDPSSLGVDDMPPIYSYKHTPETGYVNAVVGGYVYRGCRYPNLKGLYVYADYVLGKLWYLRKNSSGEWVNFDLCLGDSSVCNHGYGGAWETPHFILAFGEDEEGELYVMATTNPSNTAPTGSVYRIVDPSRQSDPNMCLETDSITIGDEGDLPVGDAANQIQMAHLTSWFLAVHFIYQLSA